MTLAAISGSITFLSQLVSPAARAVVLAGGVAFALGVFRVKATSVRLFAWTAVLYAAVAMPLLVWMLPPLSLPVPAFLRKAEAPSHIQAFGPSDVAPLASARRDKLTVRSANRISPAEAMRQNASSAPVNPAQPGDALQPSNWPSIPWTTLATGIYLVVGSLLLARFIVGIVLGRRLIRAAQEILDRRVTTKLASRARTAGLDSIPRTAESELISVPVTMGTLRSTILLPTDWREWDDAKLDAVIAHEVSHVTRHDAITQRISLLHRAVFWFSPFAWWLDRHLANLAEQVSDEAALSCGADRTDYARTLLGFFEALHAAPGRVWWQGVAMAKPGQAEKRLEGILAWRGAVTMNLKKTGLKRSIAAAIVALAVPVVYLTASVCPGHSNLHSQEGAQNPTPPAARAPIAPPAPVSTPMMPPAPAAPVSGITAVSGPAPVPPIAAVAPVPPLAPSSPRAGQPFHRHGYSYSYDYDDEQRFVIVTGKSDELTMSGSSEDARHAEKLRKQIPGDFIWFERDEKSYIIRDQATIDRARKLWAPQEELGKKQEALGKQQEALGKQQEELGKKMEEIRVSIPDMTAELDKLRAELKQLSSGATVEQMGHLQSEIGELQSKIGEIQSHAGDKQSKLGEEMGALGEKQGQLGEQQGELGRQQGELAEKASREMKELLDEAIKNGTAKPETQAADSGTL